MAIKVIGQDETLAKRVSCRHCGAVNEYLPVDVRELYKGRDVDGGMSISEGFNCGQCRHESSRGHGDYDPQQARSREEYER